MHRVVGEPAPNAKPIAVIDKALPAPSGPVTASLANASSRLVSVTDEHCLQAEKFRMLANRLCALRISRPIKVVHVTSSLMGEGKSMVSANLAVTLARRSTDRVLLIEGDLRKPSLARVLGLRNTAEMAEWWTRREAIPTPMTFAGLRLSFLPAAIVERPTEVLESEFIPDMLRRFAQEYDWVIIDSPPLLALSDSSIWARYADGTIMVVRAGVAKNKTVEKALEGLDNAKLIGFVMNDAVDRERSYYYYQYYGGDPRKRGAKGRGATRK